jgi:hypothetical protein
MSDKRQVPQKSARGFRSLRWYRFWELDQEEKDYSHRDYFTEYSGERDDFVMVEQYEVSRARQLERITRPIRTWRTRLKTIGFWIFGFITGLFCNYIAAFFSDKFPFWK